LSGVGGTGASGWLTINLVLWAESETASIQNALVVEAQRRELADHELAAAMARQFEALKQGSVVLNSRVGVDAN
jgi:hypothetical protein